MKLGFPGTPPGIGKDSLKASYKPPKPGLKTCQEFVSMLKYNQKKTHHIPAGFDVPFFPNQ